MKFITEEGKVAEGTAVSEQELAVLENENVRNMAAKMPGTYISERDILRVTTFLLSLYHFTPRTQELTQPEPAAPKGELDDVPF